MGALDTVSIGILLGSAVVLAGVLFGSAWLVQHRPALRDAL